MSVERLSGRAAILRLAAIWAALAIGACASPPQPATTATLDASLSVQDLMRALVDPAADALWESVSTEVTRAGTVQHQPASDDDWAALRLHAVRLTESANLLQIGGRPVAAAGSQLDDDGTPGILDAAGVGRAISADRAGFDAAAAQLRAAAAVALDAIDRRDVPGLNVAGTAIDHACEACHLRYWYPGAWHPGLPARAAAPRPSPAASGH